MWRDRVIRAHLREEFLVTLADGTGLQGLLVEADDKTIVLANVSQVERDRTVPVDGQLFIPRSNVLYLQKP